MLFLLKTLLFLPGSLTEYGKLAILLYYRGVDVLSDWDMVNLIFCIFLSFFIVSFVIIVVLSVVAFTIFLVKLIRKLLKW